ncbi:MAG: thioredoxin [Acutalibacteraceae bacterium]
MSVIKLTADNFAAEVTDSKLPVLIDFYADWCGPCKMVSPIVDEIADEREDIKVCKVNVDDEGELAVKFGVMSIPTLIVVKNGGETAREVGAIPKSEILALLDR